MLPVAADGILIWRQAKENTVAEIDPHFTKEIVAALKENDRGKALRVSAAYYCKCKCFSVKEGTIVFGTYRNSLDLARLHEFEGVMALVFREGERGCYAPASEFEYVMQWFILNQPHTASG